MSYKEQETETTQMAAKVNTGPGQNQEPEPPLSLPHGCMGPNHVDTGAKALGPASSTLPGTLIGSWVEN